MPAAYARLAYLPYTGHAPQYGSASARPIREAIGQSQSTCADPVKFYSRCTLIEMAGVLESEARYSEPNGAVMLAPASVLSTPFVGAHLDAGFDELGAVAGVLLPAPLGQPVTDGRYGYTGRSGHAGATWRYEHAVRDDLNTGAGMVGAAEYDRYVNAAGHAVPIGTTGVAGFVAWGGPADAVRQQV